jgi:hypothetical protein
MPYTDAWVPGTIVQVECPEKLGGVERKGFGSFFRQQSGTNWFHFPIAIAPKLLKTPGEEGNVRPQILVFYRTTNGPFIHSLHVYDGSTRIAAFEGLRFAGDHTRESDMSAPYNIWGINDPVFFTGGLGISVGVDFGTGGEIMFAGAGARFVFGE